MTISKPQRFSLTVLTLTLVCGIAVLLVWGAARSRRSSQEVSRDNVTVKSVRSTQEVSTDNVTVKVARDLEDLRQRYSRVRSVHVYATAKIIIYEERIREGAGSFEYWVDGDRYRINCRTDSQLALLNDTDLAYDGGRFYHLDRHASILSYRKLDEEKSFSALPNPFFLPVDFLSNDSDECRLCKLRLKDFRAPSARWEDQKGKISIRSKRKEHGSQLESTELEIPGVVVDKTVSKFRLRLDTKANGIGQVTKIERIQPDGKPLTLLVFSDFIPTAVGDFPRRIKIQVFDDQSAVVMEVDYTVQKIEIDQPLDPSIFTIKLSEAEGVWDSDEKKFIKETPPKRKLPSGTD
jgi:hypothetical protein